MEDLGGRRGEMVVVVLRLGEMVASGDRSFVGR